VKKGELLAQIDPRTLQASYDQALAAKRQNQALLATSRVNYQRLGKPQETIRLRVQQATDAIELEHQLVFAFDLRATHGLGIGKAVANQFEHQRITGQGKYHHDHAGRAVGMHQLLGGMRLEMAEKRAIAFGLALLGAPEHRVQLVDRLVGEQAA